jgi:hypothetical protein
MVGTASLPHILMRYYTTPSVREARKSVFWSLFFIFLLYFTAPALAVLVKFEVYSNLVGSSFASLPAWVANWSAVDATLMKIVDINLDGIVQLAEITIGGDLIVLATPEIAGLPYVISGMVAAGGLAAALSTADGLLLTIANALSHDVYYKMIDPKASTVRRLAISKGLLVLVALFAAYTASLKPGDILFLVGAAFSLAASAFFPALVLGVFWKRANYLGAVIGMLAGLGVCMYYMYITYPFFGGVAENQWFNIAPIAAGVFGMPVGFLGIIIGSLISKAPSQGNPGAGRPRSLSEPGGRHRHPRDLIVASRAPSGAQQKSQPRGAGFFTSSILNPVDARSRCAPHHGSTAVRSADRTTACARSPQSPCPAHCSDATPSPAHTRPGHSSAAICLPRSAPPRRRRGDHVAHAACPARTRRGHSSDSIRSPVETPRSRRRPCRPCRARRPRLNQVCASSGSTSTARAYQASAAGQRPCCASSQPSVRKVSGMMRIGGKAVAIGGQRLLAPAQHVEEHAPQAMPHTVVIHRGINSK